MGNTELLEKPAGREASSSPPPLLHLYWVDQLRPGGKAFCGKPFEVYQAVSNPPPERCCVVCTEMDV